MSSDTSNAKTKQGSWLNGLWIGLMVVILAGAWLVEEPFVQDTLSGWGYEPEGITAEIEDDLELTAKGKRIFRATRPIVERTADFNDHCDSHDESTMVLGCYDGEHIYIYEVKQEQLVAANNVTAAHELLHAAWARMKDGEKAQVKTWLDEVYQTHQEWFDQKELASYDEDQRVEEIYTRAGTKLKELPEDLEKHYAQYFQNRGRIVEFYEAYKAPFEKLRAELETLDAKIDQVKVEIDQERASYRAKLEALNARIDRFNGCANTAGCFQSDAEFERQRSALTSAQATLEEERAALNQKINENNARIEEYRTHNKELGDLNDAMNSNVEIEEEV